MLPYAEELSRQAIPLTTAMISEQVGLWETYQKQVDAVQPPAGKDRNSYGTGDATSARVIFYGLDGATWQILAPLAERGLLPNFQRLMAQGSYGWLKTDEAFSPVSWTSLATGRPAEPLLIHANRDELWNLPSGAVNATRWWDVLAGPEGDGLAIVDYFYCPTPHEYPRATLFQQYEWLPPIRSPEAFFARLPRTNMTDTGLPTACAATQLVLNANRFQVMAAIQRHTDFLQHQGYFFYLLHHVLGGAGLRPEIESLVTARVDDAERIVRFYQELDRQLGQILDQHPKDYVFVVSDHGFHAHAPQVYIDLNERARLAWGFPDELQQAAGEVESDWHGFRFRWRWHWRDEAYPLLRDVASGHRIYYTVSTKEVTISPVQSTRGATDALYAFLNTRIQDSRLGRKPLLLLERNGDSLTLRVAAPVRTIGCLVADLETLGPLCFNYASNFHDRNDPGVFLAAGPGIAQGRRVEQLSLYDVAPTLLYLKQKPVGRDMTGRVISEMIDPQVMSKRPVEYVDTLDSPEFLAWRRQLRQAILPGDRQYLRSLGYLR